MNSPQILVQVEGLKKYFPITRGVLIQRQVGAVRAVDDVSFELARDLFGRRRDDLLEGHVALPRRKRGTSRRSP